MQTKALFIGLLALLFLVASGAGAVTTGVLVGWTLERTSSLLTINGAPGAGAVWAVRLTMTGLAAVESLLTLRQDKLADEFVTTMNRAAEQAVPEAAAVLGDSVKQMSIADAKSIVTGTNNAATQYFRRTSETNLHARFLPIVKAATEKAGVTSAYKRMTDKAEGGLGSLGGLGAVCLASKSRTSTVTSHAKHSTLSS